MAQNLLGYECVLGEKGCYPTSRWATLTPAHLPWCPGFCPKGASLGKDCRPHFTREDPEGPFRGRTSSWTWSPVNSLPPRSSLQRAEGHAGHMGPWQPHVQAWKHPSDLTLSRTESRSLANWCDMHTVSHAGHMARDTSQPVTVSVPCLSRVLSRSCPKGLGSEEKPARVFRLLASGWEQGLLTPCPSQGQC